MSESGQSAAIPLATLKKKRNGLRAYIAKVLKKEPEQSSTLEAEIQSLTKHAANLAEQDDAIQCEMEDENEMAADIEQSCQIQDDIEKYKGKLAALLAPPILVAGSIHGGESNVSGSNRIGKGHVKLPKMELQKFSGDPIEWPPFWQQFEISVHENEDLSDVQKFTYLRMYLKDKAADVIAGIAVTNENYKHATALLEEKYGQKEIIVNAHIEALLKLPEIADPSRLRATYDKIERHIRGLEALNVPPDQYSLVVSPLILQKIPLETRLQISRNQGEGVWDLNQLRESLKAEVKALERTMLADKKGKQGGATGSFFTGSDQRQKQCQYCDDQTHKAHQCPLTPEARTNAVKTKNLCFGCLNRGHGIKTCRNKYNCSVGGRAHHKSLCPAYHTKGANDRKETTDDKKTSEMGVGTSSLLTVSENRSVLMKTAVVPISTENNSIKTNARVLFDDASQLSYATEAIIGKLQARRNDRIELSIAHFGSQKRLKDQHDVAKLVLHCKDRSTRAIEVVIVKSIAPPIYRQQIAHEQCIELDLLDLADPGALGSSNFCVDVLIGGANYYDFVETGLKRFPNGVVATESSVGWLLTGPALVASPQRSSSGTTLFVDASAQSLDKQLNRLWDLESMGIEFDQESKNCDVLAQFENTVRPSPGTRRYEVGLPWNPDVVQQLPDNRALALRRFRALQRKLRRHPELTEPYNAYFDTKIARGYVEVVSDENSQPGVVHYLPHHAVVKMDSRTTKVRPIFDASARQSKDFPSLNDALFEGPNLTGDIFRILVQFRTREIGLISDIEKAFFQIGLQESDRDCTRFFWSDSPFSYKLTVYRFTRLPFGLKCSPFFLNATIRHHLRKFEGPVASLALDGMYVDNCVVSVDSVEDAQTFYDESKRVLTEAEMNLREWASNSDEFMSTVQGSDQVEDQNVKVLGLSWDRQTDRLNLKGIKPVKIEPITKRKILQVVSSVYDPLGFSSPITSMSRVFLQKLWKAKIAWDDPIPDELLNEWRDIQGQLNQLESSIQVPRFLGVGGATTQELHVFADASPLAYAAVAYLRVKSDDGVSVKLICSKAKVAPVKRKLTLPKLELMAAVVAKRLAVTVMSSMKCTVERTVVWSDSSIALSWIRSKGKFKEIFIRSRVAEIREINADFFHVPGSSNPADFATRAITTNALKACEVWFQGPAWLWKNEDQYPTQVNLPEVDTKLFQAISLHVAGSEIQVPVDIARFSVVQKLHRVVARCLIVVGKMRKKDAKMNTKYVVQAKILVERWVQRSSFNEVFESLESERPNSIARQFSLFVDQNGLLRCRGRLDQSSLPLNAMYPKLLPRDHPYTKLIIEDVHARLMHQGLNHTVSAIRQEYWIPKAKQQVKKLLRKCVVCRKWEGRPYPGVETAPLPSFRVNVSPPFSYTGLDFAGPISCTEGKVWFCIFTCAVTRAIHLELVGDMTTVEFLLALRRFISRRGRPCRIISDNAKTFKLADQTLQHLWCQAKTADEVESYLSSEGIRWQYNVERAPWWGGFFERMVGLVKRCLKKTVGCRKLKKVELETQLIEIEAVLNSRPMTFLTDDIGELPLAPIKLLQPLGQVAGCLVTPDHMSRVGPKPGFPDADANSDPFDPEFLPKEDSVQAVTKRMKHTQRVLDAFWKKWQNEYLLQLREYHKPKKHIDNKAIPKKGEVVLVKEDMARGSWRLAVIQDWITGKDGLVRAAVLRTGKTLLQRPIELLVPLEIMSKSIDEDVRQENDEVKVPTENDDSQLPRRQAALSAEQKIKDIFESAAPEDV